MKKVDKELLLLRHGKSNWHSGVRDFNRPLNKRGKRNAQQMGEWIGEQKFVPDLIISSPAKRALTTSEIVCEAMELSLDTIQTEESIYEACLADLHQVLLHIPEGIQRCLLIGHNPGFEYLLSDLTADISIPDNEKRMPTATLAYFELDSNWSSLQRRFRIQCPKDL